MFIKEEEEALNTELRIKFYSKLVASFTLSHACTSIAVLN